MCYLKGEAHAEGQGRARHGSQGERQHSRQSKGLLRRSHMWVTVLGMQCRVGLTTNRFGERLFRRLCTSQGVFYRHGDSNTKGSDFALSWTFDAPDITGSLQVFLSMHTMVYMLCQSPRRAAQHLLMIIVGVRITIRIVGIGIGVGIYALLR